jgi:flagellum-specific peptidoglycan hydrolase FlgJ
MRLITSDIYGPNGAPKTEDITDEQKKEIQETILQGLQGWVTNTKDSLLNLTPEFIEEGVNDGLDGVQSILESLPETASGLVDSLKGTLGDVGLPGFDATTKAALEEGAEEVTSAVTDALLGKQAHASDTPESNTGASDSHLTTTEKIAFDKQAKQAEAAQSNDKAFMDDLLGVKSSEEPVKPEDVIPAHLRKKLGKGMVWTDTVMTPAQKAAGTVADGNGGVNTKKAFDKHFGVGKFAEVKAEQRKQFALQTKRLSEHFASSIGKHIKPEWVQNMWMHETKHGNSVLAGTYNLGNIKGSYNGKSGKFEVHEYLSKKDIKKHKDAGTFVKLGEGYRDKKRKVYIKDDFRQYPNFVEAATDFVRLLNKPRYTKVKEAKTQREFVTALHAAGYMTDSVEKYLAGLKVNDKLNRG